MSLYVIVFNRERGTLVTMHRVDSQKEADSERIQLELEHRHQPEIEVVVLEAASEDQLRSTHARYFGSGGLEDLAKAATAQK